MATLVGLLALASWAWAHDHMGRGDKAKPSAPAHGSPMEHRKMESEVAPPPPFRTTMEEIHRRGGVPPGWGFLLPQGDPAEGKKVYIAMKCFTCHEIKGEDFPPHAKEPGQVGPELTGMGTHHPPEYFAETIVNPNRVIIEGPGYTGHDGLSKMPDYNDTLTVRQLIDLVTYLKSLTGIPHPAAPAAPASAPSPRSH